MRINHNISALNTYNKLTANTAATSKSLEKLSSGLKINKAGDNAAGLAISEKMRGQIRGLDQASTNANDAISLINTAEGALSETHSILQRMRELAVQSANDTNVNIDRSEIQKEMNQLSSEINRIGNTTEFNTKALLKGDGNVNLKSTGITSVPGTMKDGTTTHVEAKQTVNMIAGVSGTINGMSLEFDLNGEKITIGFETNASITDSTAEYKADSATANAATVYTRGTAVDTTMGSAVREALQSAINANDKLKGNYIVSGTGVDVTVAAETIENGGEFYGNKGYIGAVAANANLIDSAEIADIGTTTVVQAKHEMDFASVTSAADAEALIGKGFTAGDKQYEFYNANDGAYAGKAIGVNISSAIEATSDWDEAVATAVAGQVKGEGFTAAVSGANPERVVFTATAIGADGNNTVSFSDGGVQKAFEATMQVGANKGQGFKIDINDMRSEALKVTGTAGADATEGAKFTATNTVTNGTDSTLSEAALDVSTHENATAAIKVINNSIESVSAERSKLGAFQNRLEHTIANLGTSSESLTTAESRIRDVDMAKEMMEFTKNNILSQAAQSMLAQANQQPQGVLQLLQ
ncbi:MAG: flagellin [Eubacteriaceae bacterium]|nr:flagellin [Eubacteriaceae bacterium]